jgi:integrase
MKSSTTVGQIFLLTDIPLSVRADLVTDTGGSEALVKATIMNYEAMEGRVLSVNDCWEFYKETHLPFTASPKKTIARWSSLKWFGQLDAEKITPQDISRYITSRGVQHGTINRDLAMLNAIIRHAWKAGKISRTPFIQKMPAPPPKLRYLSREEAEKVVASARMEDWQTLVFVLIGLSSGARTGAILELTWDKIDEAAGTVDFRSSQATAPRKKGRAVVPIGDMLREALSIAKTHANGPYVIHRNGKPISSVQRMIGRVAKRSGITDFTAHVMRHTVASLLLQGGADLLRVSRLLGHKNSKTTETVYFQHNTGYLKPLTDKLKFS